MSGVTTGILGQPNGVKQTTTDAKYCNCIIRVNLISDRGGTRVGVFSSDDDASTQFNWNKKDPSHGPAVTAAHEVGHFLGNTEEYGKVSKPQAVGTSVVKGAYGQGFTDGTGSIMGASPKNGQAKARHFWRVMKQLETSEHLKNCKLEEIK